MNPRTDLQFADDFIVEAIEAAQAREEAARARAAEQRRVRMMDPMPPMHAVRPARSASWKPTGKPARAHKVLSEADRVVLDLLLSREWPTHTALAQAYSAARGAYECSLAALNVRITAVRRHGVAAGIVVPYRTKTGVQPRAYYQDQAEPAE